MGKGKSNDTDNNANWEEENMKEKQDPGRSVRRLLPQFRKERNYGPCGLIKTLYTNIIINKQTNKQYFIEIYKS